MTTHDDTPLVLIVAGTDPCAGAGMVADLRVCGDLGCWGMPVVSAVVAQSTRGVRCFEAVSVELFEAQLHEILTDCTPQAIKIGMLASAELVAPLVSCLRPLRRASVPVVFDPVLASGHGTTLARATLVDALKHQLLPEVDVLTPNAVEASVLLGREVDSIAAMETAAEALRALGPRAVLLKGGHIPGAPGDALAYAGGVRFFPNSEILPVDVHGTGCHLASALACGLAHGRPLIDVVEEARAFLLLQMRTRRFKPGKGREILRGAPRRGAG